MKRGKVELKKRRQREIFKQKKWRTVLEEIGGAKQFGGKLNGDSIRGQRAKDTIELQLSESEKVKTPPRSCTSGIESIGCNQHFKVNLLGRGSMTNLILSVWGLPHHHQVFIYMDEVSQGCL